MVNTSIFNADRDNSGFSYYNGRTTIEKKVELAANETSGIMIWEVGQEQFDEYSLLRAWIINNRALRKCS